MKMEEITKIIEILKWPIVVIFSVIILKRPLAELINGITDFNIGGKHGLSARINRDKFKSLPNKKSLDKTSRSIDSIYFSDKKSGQITFDYSNNNGVYTIGSGDCVFDTMWTKASKEYIHFYNDKPSIKTIRLVKDISDINQVNPQKYDSSSRARTVGIGQIAIFENTYNKFLITKILNIKDDSRGDDHDEITFEYKILDYRTRGLKMII